MNKLFRLLWSVSFAGLVLGLVLATASPAFADPPLPGAIFTTDIGCSGVDLNIYGAKTDVYLNGGPKHPGAASLPNGSYYVQVTDPSGHTVLGTSIGSGNERPYTVINGVNACLEIWNIVIKGSDASQGYDDTPNAGGEYKVWVSNESSFTNSSTKTDNFKIRTSCDPNDAFCDPLNKSFVWGFKWYDTNANGVRDSGEIEIPGWEVSIFGGPDGFVGFTTNTGVTPNPPGDLFPGHTGAYLITDLDPGTYGVCEVIPSGQPTWVPTTATVNSSITVPPDAIGLANFGNVCLGSGGGLTLGFWSNKNGQSLETKQNLCMLNTLNLVNGNGSNYDPIAGCANSTAAQITAAKTSLHNWILGANASNMANMLSAQLAAMELNVATGGVSGTALVYAPGAPSANSAGFETVNQLMADANTLLVAPGNVTVAASALRSTEETVKTALDKANNNLNFVQASACQVNYSVNDTCAP
jgi:hypothetical protein